MASYRPAARRWAQSCSWCSPRWSCQSRPSWRHTSCKGTQTPWRRWHSAWWRPPTRCWSAWHGRSWFGQCWSPGIEPAAGRESRSRGTHPPRYAWDGEGRMSEMEGQKKNKKKRERHLSLGLERIVLDFHTNSETVVNTIPPCDIMWKYCSLITCSAMDSKQTTPPDLNSISAHFLWISNTQNIFQPTGKGPVELVHLDREKERCFV